MGKYTIALGELCELEVGVPVGGGYSTIKDTIERAVPKVFDFDFPMFDEKYRDVLCGKILKHYWTREIGAETVGLFKLWLDTKLNEIMPYYNQLYKSTLLEFNPLYDVDITTTHKRTNDGTTDVQGQGVEDGEHTSNLNTENSENTKRTGQNTIDTSSDKTNNTTTTNKDERSDAYSDTPQGTLANVRELSYLTNFRSVKDDNTTTEVGTAKDVGKVNEENVTNAITSGTGKQAANSTDHRTTNKNEKTTAKTTEDYLQIVQGKQSGGSYARMLTEYRKTFLNIDSMIIDELSGLFFGLW